MHALADWLYIAKLVQILYCIKIDIYIICSIVDQALVVDIFVHSSGPFCTTIELLVDLFLSRGFFGTHRIPLATALCSATQYPNTLNMQ